MLKFLRSSWGLVAAISPNRRAVYLTSIAGLVTALVPVLANLDITSLAGLLGGFSGVVVIVNRWLVGWQNLEKAEAQNTVHALATEREAHYAAEARAAATAPRPAASKLNLPR